jgi:hypothetical protein
MHERQFPGRATSSSEEQRGSITTYSFSHGLQEAAAGLYPQFPGQTRVHANIVPGNGPGRFVPLQTTKSVIVSGVANISLPCIQTVPRMLLCYSRMKASETDIMAQRCLSLLANNIEHRELPPEQEGCRRILFTCRLAQLQLFV